MDIYENASYKSNVYMVKVFDLATNISTDTFS